jgi:L-alanine-DL-glutamate epimerase-like enolase superfamily enzyme
MNRRMFLGQAAMAYGAFLLHARAQGTSHAPALTIREIRAVRLRDGFNSRFIRVYTDQGLTGTGEMLDTVGAVSVYQLLGGRVRNRLPVDLHPANPAEAASLIAKNKVKALNSPLGTMAAAYVAAATPNLMLLEFTHFVDQSYTSLTEPVSLDGEGFLEARTTPGIGVALNEDVVKERTDPEFHPL